MKNNSILQFVIFFALSSCASSQAAQVSESSLQHHRWVLESVNGEAIDIQELGSIIPELEIGEQLAASGNSGCNRFFGTAVLQKNQFSINPVGSTRMLCKPVQNELEYLFLQLLGQWSTISLDAENNLTLKTENTLLEFRLEDRVQ